MAESYWSKPVMAERLAAQRAWNEHQRWLADARQKLADAEEPAEAGSRTTDKPDG